MKLTIHPSKPNTPDFVVEYPTRAAAQRGIDDLYAKTKEIDVVEWRRLTDFLSEPVPR